MLKYKFFCGKHNDIALLGSPTWHCLNDDKANEPDREDYLVTRESLERVWTPSLHNMVCPQSTFANEDSEECFEADWFMSMTTTI